MCARVHERQHVRTYAVYYTQGIDNGVETRGKGGGHLLCVDSEPLLLRGDLPGSTYCDEHSSANRSHLLWPEMRKRAAETVRNKTQAAGALACSARSRSLLCVAASASFSRAFSTSASRACRECNAERTSAAAWLAACRRLASRALKSASGIA